MQSAVAYTPIDTAGSPFSMRISVGTETSSRAAQTRSGWLRRLRAVVRSAPSLRSAAVAAGGRRQAAGLPQLRLLSAYHIVIPPDLPIMQADLTIVHRRMRGERTAYAAPFSAKKIWSDLVYLSENWGERGAPC